MSAAPRGSVRLEDHSEDLAQLADRGADGGTRRGVTVKHGNPRLVAPLTSLPVGGANVLWLLQSDSRHALVAAETAPRSGAS